MYNQIMETFPEKQINTVNPKLNSATGGFAYSITAVTYVVVSLLVNGLIVLAKIEQWSTAYIYLIFIASPIGIAAGVFLTLALRKVKIKETVPVKCGVKYYVIALLLVFGLFFALNRINDLFLKLFNLNTSEQTVKISEFLLGLKGWEVLPAVLVIALLPAVFEELLFRGVILQSLLHSVGSVRAIILSGFAFSLFHGSPEQTVYQFIAGCLFAFIAVRSGSILPSVIMHFINNALVIILGVCVGADENGNFLFPQGLNIALIVIGALCLVGGVLWLIFDKKELLKCQKNSVKVFFVYACAGIAVMALFWIAAFAEALMQNV